MPMPDLCFINSTLCVGNGVGLNTVQGCLYLCEEGELRECNRDQSLGIKERQAEDMEGIKGVEEGLGRAGGGNEEEQWWSGGKGEPSKHFPVHFSSGRLN